MNCHLQINSLVLPPCSLNTISSIKPDHETKLISQLFCPSLWFPHYHVKQPASVRSRVCRIKAILALLDQLTRFGQWESLTIHASSGSGRISAVSSAQFVNMLQSVTARWRCTKWFGNRKFLGGHSSKYLWSQTLLSINNYMTGTLSKAIWLLFSLLFLHTHPNFLS